VVERVLTELRNLRRTGRGTSLNALLSHQTSIRIALALVRYRVA
jgi:hypothetical protein